jgi:hypothetical protein
MTHKQALHRTVGNKIKYLWGYNSGSVGYCEIGYEKGFNKAPTVFHGVWRITYHPVKKANVMADCLENQFTSHELCDENHEWQAETAVQALLASVDDTPLGK